MVIRIQHLQWLGGAVAAAACLALGALSLKSGLSNHIRYQAATEQLDRFNAVLLAAAAVSAERGPSNNAMSGPDEDREALARQLAAARARTDRDIATVEAKFAAERITSPAIDKLTHDLHETLRAGRQAVDAVASLPAAGRDGAAIRQAVKAMFTAADSVTILRNRLGREVMVSSPELASHIMVNSLAGSLREETGRIGSFVVMKLNADPAAYGGLDARRAESRARIDVMRDGLRTYASAFLHRYGIDKAVEEVEVSYFRSALPYAETVAARIGDRHHTDPVRFTSIYVPGLKPVEELRDRVVTASRDTIDQLRAEALMTVLASLLFTGIAVLAIIAIGIVFRNGLFRPLLEARRQISQIADGDLSEPPAQTTASIEIRSMFQRLDLLRAQQRQRVALELEQARLSEKLRHLSQTDMLTGLMNRRAFKEAADRAFSEADRDGGPVSIILFDIDHFKAINDLYGHAIGDEALKALAESLSKVLGPEASFARHGGEEFIVLLPGADSDAGFACAETLRETLATVAVPAAPGLTITGSFGVAVREPGAAEALEPLIALADRRLYMAKITGRNTVCAGDPFGSLRTVAKG